MYEQLQNKDINKKEEIVIPNTNKVNILIKQFASVLQAKGIPNAIMAWDAEKSRYVYAGAMPEEIGDGTQFSSRKLTKFIRFLEVCTDFDRDNYKFNL